jgi:hypothetical protein
MFTESRVRPLVGLLYLGAFIILASQALDLFLAARATAGDPGSPEWRFAFLGLVSGKVGWLIVADTLVLAALVRLEHRTGLKAAGLVHLGITPVVGVALLVLAHDTLELRSSVSDRSVDFAALRTGFPLAATGLLVFVVGILAVRSARNSRGLTRRRPITPLLTDTEPAHRPFQRRSPNLQQSA